MSVSRFTLSPTFIGPKVVTARVKGISETLNRSGSQSTIVRLTPSMAIDPFEAICRANSRGTANEKSDHSPMSWRPSSVPRPSICPLTKCPPRRSPTAKARSRLTGLPVFRSPRLVRLSVSGPASKCMVSSSVSTTVKQHPLTEMLSATLVSSAIFGSRMTNRQPGGSSRSSATLPSASTIPENIRFSSVLVLSPLHLGEG